MSSSGEPKRNYVLASRASVLAKIQTEATVELLQRSFPQLSFSTSYMTTEGDKNQSQALYVLGGKSLWTKELEVALLEGDVDMLVHCVKDMPTTLPPGCILSAITEREDPVDSLVVKKDLRIDGKPLDALLIPPIIAYRPPTQIMRRKMRARMLHGGHVLPIGLCIRSDNMGRVGGLYNRLRHE